ncbi:TTK protein kinase [Saprolegnia parasitica CBS 223.65]|uniref:TTK protein kinase n=1 Tax=Saprolegnia parasitica (strain CBS 223.65) TaxID=695850 RepID=A0A067BZQ7_SAPPC|nr:TTK protein kinase [Saprolegnia parasitica CBS 223.65]KDO23738.1 TTK protein kinase [Saprolegnia parasitica CBS 223.65]|eukprot:XP_012205556.1 TTK protein kinase [Saprolegnia parasitica CBS 223.65]
MIRSPMLRFGENETDIFLLDVSVCDVPGDTALGTALMVERNKLAEEARKDPLNIEVMSRLLKNCSRLYSQHPRPVELLFRRAMTTFQRQPLDSAGADLWIEMLLGLGAILAADTMKKRDILSQASFSAHVKGKTVFYEYFANFEMQQNRSQAAQDLLNKAVEKDMLTPEARQQIWDKVQRTQPDASQAPREFVSRPPDTPVQASRSSHVYSTPRNSTTPVVARATSTTLRTASLAESWTTPLQTESRTTAAAPSSVLRTTSLSSALTTPLPSKLGNRDARSTQRKPQIRPSFQLGSIGLPMRVRQSAASPMSPDEEDDKVHSPPPPLNRPLVTGVKREPKYSEDDDKENSPAAPSSRPLVDGIKREAKYPKKAPFQEKDISYIKDWNPARTPSVIESTKAKRALGYLDPNSLEVHNVPASPAVSDASDMEIELSRQSVREDDEDTALLLAKKTPPSGRKRALSPSVDHARSHAPSASSTPSSASPPEPATPFRNTDASSDVIARLIDSKNHIVVNGVTFLSLKQIGSGGSSKVFRVLGPDMQTYALKKIKMKRMDDASVISYENEIMMLKRLQGSPYIIKLLANEMDYEGKVLYVVMEQGEIDLKDKLKELKNNQIVLEENFLRITWQQMLQAVNYIHNQRVIHGDLKPANFLFVNGALKLIDFGIAKAISNDTTNIVRENHEGTANFMPPEVASGIIATDHAAMPKKVGRAGDIWSLGCILYQIVYGDTPFGTFNNIFEKFVRISDPNYAITFKKLHNKPLEDVIRSCLQRDPKLRPTIEGPHGLLEHPFLNPNKGGLTPSTLETTLAKATQFIYEHGCSPAVVDIADQLQAAVSHHHLTNVVPNSQTAL